MTLKLTKANGKQMEMKLREMKEFLVNKSSKQKINAPEFSKINPD